MYEKKLKIAFVCVHNSCRSQIAEALVKKFMINKYDFYSCGTELKPQINQDAVKLIKELYQIDMEKEQYSKLIQDIPEVDIVISMGCNVKCPYVGKDFDDNWNLDNPTGKNDDEFIKVIKKIENKIKNLNY
ncbi:MAG: arsenate reductase ArsC [Thomasclavelia spiroformis]